MQIKFCRYYFQVTISRVEISWNEVRQSKWWPNLSSNFAMWFLEWFRKNVPSIKPARKIWGNPEKARSIQTNNSYWWKTGAHRNALPLTILTPTLVCNLKCLQQLLFTSVPGLKLVLISIFIYYLKSWAFLFHIFTAFLLTSTHTRSISNLRMLYHDSTTHP